MICTRTLLTTLSCMLLVVSMALGEVASKSPAPMDKPVVLAKDGKAMLPIVTGSQDAPVKELQTYLKKMSGADFAIEKSEPGKAGIYVGLASDFGGMAFEGVDNLGAEGFLWMTDGQSAYLIAKEPRGVQHAVSTALQDMGCRWFFPGKTWEVIPTSPTISVTWKGANVPSFPTQRKMFYGFGSFAEPAKDMAAWDRHNRMGGPFAISIGHTSYGLDAKNDFKEHPEWFGLVNGVRKPAKPCFSNPEVIARATQWALAQAKKDGGHGMISMTPSDGLGYCECPECFKVFHGKTPKAEHGTFFATLDDGTVVCSTSETLFAFINKVAEAVGKEYPDMMLGSYAYSAYSHPPSFKMLPNVYIQTTTSYRRTPLSLQEQLSQWGNKAKKVDIRGYWSVYQWDYDTPDPTAMRPEKQKEQLTNFVAWKATGVNSEASNNWGPRGLGYYVASQLLWNVQADTKAIIKDFYEKAFGPAAKPMERYYVRWYGRGSAVTIEGGEPAKFDHDSLKAAFGDLDEAAALVKDLPAYRDRVDNLRMYAHYLLLRQHTEGLGGKAKGKASKAKAPAKAEPLDKNEIDEPIKVAADSHLDESSQQIIDAVKAETIFGGRLTNTNMIHSRPLIGKAFLRRFGKFASLLSEKQVVDGKEQAVPLPMTKEWTKIGTPPTHEELEQLWAQDKAEMGIK